MNRGYFVYGKDEPRGIPVVAKTAREAKRIGFTAYELDCDWTDIRCHWQRHANVDGLQAGIVHDYMDALRRDITHWIDDAPCDVCGAEDAYLESVDGLAVCQDCVERIHCIWNQEPLKNQQEV